MHALLFADVSFGFCWCLCIDTVVPNDENIADGSGQGQGGNPPGENVEGEENQMEFEQPAQNQ